jgi:hypothetical protein
MSEDGKNILKMIKQNKKLFEEMALLLKTSDEQMQKNGWEADGSGAIYDMSKSLNDPQRWLPNYLFRIYFNSEYENILAYVSILLDDDVYGGYEDIITEPLITAGYFDYGEGNKVEEYQQWFTKWYGFWMEKRREDEIIYEDKKNWKKEWEERFPKDDVDFEHYRCFGIPLTSITNTSELESKIVNHLLGLIQEYQ